MRSSSNSMVNQTNIISGHCTEVLIMVDLRLSSKLIMVGLRLPSKIVLG